MAENSHGAIVKQKCIDPQISGKIALEIAFSIAQRKGIHLTPEQAQHLVDCEECNQLLSHWFKKGDAARKGDAALNIVDLAEAGDSRVLKKTTRSGTALFKPYEDDSSKGLLVEISSTGTISSTQEITLDEFNRLDRAPSPAGRR